MSSKPRFVGEKVKLGELLLNTFSGEWGTEEGELLTPVLRTSNFNEDGSLNYSTPAMRCISEGKVAKKRMVRGDIILEKSGGTPKRPVGIMAFYDSDALALCSNFNQVLRFDESRILPRFAFHQLRWLKDRNAFDRYTRKTTGLQNLQMKKLIELKLRVPQIEAQTSIATTLDEIVCDQRTLQQEIACLDSLVKSRFIEMFGDPAQNNFHWRMAPLGENAKLINGRAYKQNELLASGKYPVLRVGNFFSNRDWYYSDLELDEKKYCNNGDLLYAWSASFGPKIWDGGKVIYHYHIWKVEVGDAYNKHFLCNLLKYAERSFLGDTHGIGMLHLTKAGMEEAPLIVPPLDLQDRFAAFASRVDKSRFVRDHEINFRWERFTLSWSTIA